MATLIDDGGGFRRLQFFLGSQRRTIYLGRMDRRSAETVKVHVEKLVNAKGTGGAMDGQTCEWLASIGDRLHAKLGKAGLVAPRTGGKAVAVGEFTRQYIDARGDVTAGTRLVLEQARKHLVEFFGEHKPLCDVTPGDADDYRAWLVKQGFASATVIKWSSYARQFFRAAWRKRLIPENPFADIKGSVKGNPARQAFVAAADVEKIIAICPDPQWKLLLALARYGGLRIPTEAIALKWDDIDFEHGRMTIHCVKTARYAGKATRLAPIFPQILPHLLAVHEAAPEGTEYVITRYRDNACNLRTQLLRYIAKAGLAPWPKLWQNLRSTRATELADIFPAHVVNAWLGHTEAVAQEHYRQVTDEHYRRALGLAGGNQQDSLKTEAAQNPAHHTAKQQETEDNFREGRDEKSPDIALCFAPLRSIKNLPVGQCGFERCELAIRAP
jgi:integrase